MIINLTSVLFFPMGRFLFNKGLGTVCLSRSDAVRLFQNTKKSSGRSNLRTQVKNVTENKLLCYGVGESYDLDKLCKEELLPLDGTCTLGNGEILELNPNP